MDGAFICDLEQLGLLSFVDRIARSLALEGPLDQAQQAKLLEIADKCPVHRTLKGEVLIETVLAPSEV